MEKPGIMLYFDITPTLDQLPRKTAGDLLMAALHYGESGEVPELTGRAALLWPMLQAKLDLDDGKYRERSRRGQYRVYCREQKKLLRTPMEYEPWKQREELLEALSSEAAQ